MKKFSLAVYRHSKGSLVAECKGTSKSLVWYFNLNVSFNLNMSGVLDPNLSLHDVVMMLPYWKNKGYHISLKVSQSVFNSNNHISHKRLYAASIHDMNLE